MSKSTEARRAISQGLKRILSDPEYRQTFQAAMRDRLEERRVAGRVPPGQTVFVLRRTRRHTRPAVFHATSSCMTVRRADELGLLRQITIESAVRYRQLPPCKYCCEQPPLADPSVEVAA